MKCWECKCERIGGQLSFFLGEMWVCPECGDASSGYDLTIDKLYRSIQEISGISYIQRGTPRITSLSEIVNPIQGEKDMNDNGDQQ